MTPPSVYRWYPADVPSLFGLANPDQWDVFRYKRGPLELSGEVEFVGPAPGEVPADWRDHDFWDADVWGAPLVGERAYEVLSPVLSDDVQFVPARCGGVRFFLMNPLRKVEVDEATSVIGDGEPPEERWVAQWGFRPADVEGVLVFAISQESIANVYFTDAFVRLCDESGLRGLTQLELVWSEEGGPVRRPAAAFILAERANAAAGIVDDWSDDDEDLDIDVLDDDDEGTESHGAFGVPTEAPLDTATLADFAAAAAEGFASLPGSRSDPHELAGLMSERVEALRGGELDEETWMEVGSTLGPALGELIVRRYGWSWVVLTHPHGGHQEIVVVPADRSVFVSPVAAMLERLAGDGSDITSLFIACQDPASVSGAQPGEYLRLGG